MVKFRIVDPGSEEARSAVRHYFEELDERFPAGFDPESVGYDSPGHPQGIFLLVYDDQDVIACGGVNLIDGATAEIKRMWVDPDHRGLGLGKRLLSRLEAEAAALGAIDVFLDTNETLTEAIAMYERAGYRPTDRYNDNPYAQQWFRKKLP